MAKIKFLLQEETSTLINKENEEVLERVWFEKRWAGGRPQTAAYKSKQKALEDFKQRLDLA